DPNSFLDGAEPPVKMGVGTKLQKPECARDLPKLMSTREKSAGAAANRVRPALRVLLVEDSQLDAELLARALERGGFELTWIRVDTAEAMEEALGRQQWDLILCDHAMPRF